MRRIERVVLNFTVPQGKMEIISFDTEGRTHYMANKTQKTNILTHPSIDQKYQILYQGYRMILLTKEVKSCKVI